MMEKIESTMENEGMAGLVVIDKEYRQELMAPHHFMPE